MKSNPSAFLCFCTTIKKGQNYLRRRRLSHSSKTFRLWGGIRLDKLLLEAPFRAIKVEQLPSRLFKAEEEDELEPIMLHPLKFGLGSQQKITVFFLQAVH
mmetsp:Transcript_24308/g.30147  ORF Transcript_24308/g.30147 Transcript_24308/m.30147 type:complete len:100 (+) Transcript_24308:161-460(+)